MKPKVLIAAGGTGGHLIPAQQLASLLQQNYASDVLFAGHKLKCSPYFDRSRFAFLDVPSAPLSNPFHFCKQFLRGFIAALALLHKEKPILVIGFGSYHTAPLLLAAALLRKKIVLYEANRIMGKVNRLIAPFAEAIAIQFPMQEQRSIVQIASFPWICPEKPIKQEALKFYGLQESLPTVLIFGGSQGAAFFNQIMPDALQDNQFQVIHLAGNETAAKEVEKRYRAHSIVATVKGFEANMQWAYAAADVAICRSGAGAISELIRYEVPALLIPYPQSRDQHQMENAKYLQSLGVASVLTQETASIQQIRERLFSLPLDAMRLAAIQQKEQHRGQMQFDKLVARIGGFE